MSLEDEIAESLRHAWQRDPKALEALMTPGGVEAGWEDVMGIVVRRIDALQDAVLRLAREIDGLRP